VSPFTLIIPGAPDAEAVPPVEDVHSAEYAVIAKPLLDPGEIDKSIQETAPDTVKPRLYEPIVGDDGAAPAWTVAVEEYAESPADDVEATRKS
jgi:hypothetical protein